MVIYTPCEPDFKDANKYAFIYLYYSILQSTLQGSQSTLIDQQPDIKNWEK